MGVLSLLLLAALIFVVGNLVLLPLWLAATTLAGALHAPGQFLSIAGNRRLRQNHALEHATLNVLTERHGPPRLSGLAREGGFVLKGFADPESVRAAAEEGLTRLKLGERSLAIHDRCGTSMAAANLMASVFLLVALLGLGRLSLVNVILVMLLANLSGPAFGRLFQRFLTTTTDVKDVFIIGFECGVEQSGWPVFLVNPAHAGVPVVCFVRTALLRPYGG
ncbi:MAG: hypothetical protein C4551_11010 [Bacillota bacterium]|nr:MAG: hypothetical protein C4551_11010 [Bacillota bacterium]